MYAHVFNFRQRIILILLTLVLGGITASADEEYNVVYLKLSGATGDKDGSSEDNAVGTWADAYSKLPKYTGTTDADRDAAWDKNIIVVCDKSGQLNITDGNTGKRPATITGVWPWVDSKGNSPVPSTIQGKVNLSSSPRIGADTKFKYLNFGQGMLSMYLHDCTFDVGCFMNGISSDLTAENGALRVEGDVSRAPEFQVFLYANSQNFDPSKTDGGLPTQTKPVTLTIKSGKFGRILTNRLTGTDTDAVKKRYVMGRPSSPFMCIVNLDVDPNTSTGVWNTRNDVYDIAYLCAGMTQGMVYSDVQFNIKRGTIGTLVAAMQGNSHTATASVGISNSSFFGRTEVNINPVRDEDVTIYRYFATCFGRYTDNANTKGTSNAAFYGKSTLNMYGGTIESGVFATAGGIAGLKSPDGAYHTTDKFIPYLDEGADYVNYPFMGIKYQAYDETGTKSMPTFKTTLHGKSETIDLSETVTEMNIYGGTVNGGIFGGGYGFSPEMPAERAIAGAGSFWGETRVNIYGGTIAGGIYGGGAGASNYFNASTSDAQRTGFSTVASVYGDTHVNIYGGDISDGIFGGGKGLDSQAAGSQKIWDGAAQTTVTCQATEFADVAKVYGNTNVTINPQILKDRAEWADPNVPEFTGPDEGWTYTGNIYGGGALGSVEGNTNVTILGGTINGNVFGAGQGEDGHPDKAKVTGKTKVTVGEE
ncbi:MAG: hypothetical protein KBS69_01635 [Bacteroidales bacterium]|nr:hypothetical protein [Candidatus Colicola caccequi]